MKRTSQSIRKTRLGNCDYQKLETRQVLANFVPVDAQVNDGELLIQADPTSDWTILRGWESGDGQISMREVIELDKSDPSDPVFVYGDTVVFDDVSSVRYLGNDGRDIVNIKSELDVTIYGYGNDDHLRGDFVVGGSGNDVLFGSEVYGNEGSDWIRGLYDRPISLSVVREPIAFGAAFNLEIRSGGTKATTRSMLTWLPSTRPRPTIEFLGSRKRYDLYRKWK